jgi:hypothetical protein
MLEEKMVAYMYTCRVSVYFLSRETRRWQTESRKGKNGLPNQSAIFPSADNRRLGKIIIHQLRYLYYTWPYLLCLPLTTPVILPLRLRALAQHRDCDQGMEKAFATQVSNQSPK